MPEVSEAYVIGQLTEMEAELPRLTAELTQARSRAARIGPELAGLVGRMEQCKAAVSRLRRQTDDAATAVSDHNSRMASLHQEIAALRRPRGQSM